MTQSSRQVWSPRSCQSLRRPKGEGLRSRRCQASTQTFLPPSYDRKHSLAIIWCSLRYAIWHCSEYLLLGTVWDQTNFFRALTSNYRTLTSITVVDCPGFQNSASVATRATRKAGTFSDLCFNYVNERLHQLLYQSNFTNQMELYKQEQVDVDFQEPQAGPQTIVEIMDKQSQKKKESLRVAKLFA